MASAPSFAPMTSDSGGYHDQAGDRSWLDRLLVGDDSALSELYDAYSSLVTAIAVRTTGSRSLADDVVQEVFCRIWQHPERIDLSRGSFKVLLSVMAHRKAVDAVRRAEASRARDDRANRSDEVIVLEDTPDAAVVEADALARRSQSVLSALERLPEQQRDAIRLAYFGGYTYREVAVRLSIPEGTAKSRLRLGLARLREELQHLVNEGQGS